MNIFTFTVTCIANAFKYLKQNEDAKEAFSKAALCYEQAELFYQSAKVWDLLGQLLQNVMKRPDEASKAFRSSSEQFLRDNKPDRAIEELERAAKCYLEPLSTVNTDTMKKAVPYLEDAMGMSEDNERGALSVDLFKRAINVYLRLGQLQEAIGVCKRLAVILQQIRNQHLFYKNQLTIIVILLKFGDEVEASKQFEQGTRMEGFASSDEGVIAANLLDAFEQHNQESVEEIVKRPNIAYLDNEAVKLAKQLRVMGAPSKPPANSQPQLPPNAPQGFSELTDDLPPPPTNEETNELC